MVFQRAPRERAALVHGPFRGGRPGSVKVRGVSGRLAAVSGRPPGLASFDKVTRVSGRRLQIASRDSRPGPPRV